MARPVGIGRPISYEPRALSKLGLPQPPKVISYWRKPKGKNIIVPITDLSPAMSPELINLRVDRDLMTSRPGTTLFGTSIIPTIAQFGQFTAPAFPVKGWGLTTDNPGQVYKNDSGVWILVGNIGAGHIIATGIRAVPFGTGLFFAQSGSRGGWFWDTGADTLTFATVPGTLGITTHIASFNERIVVCTSTLQVAWSAKDIATDFTAIGSGFEDLSTSPGGLDAPQAVAAYTDVQAILVRGQSVWLMSITGFVDQPFLFTLLDPGIGSNFPGTVIGTPLGVIFVGNDNVFISSAAGVSPIGDAIMPELTAVLTPSAIAGYNGVTREYRVIPFIGSPVAYIYNFIQQAWYKYQYPSPVQYISSDQPFWDLTLPNGVIARDNATDGQDVNSANVRVTSPIEARTGAVLGANPLNKTRVMEARLEYLSAGTQTLIFEYSVDGGTTWNPYSSAVVNQTPVPKVLYVRKAVTAQRPMIRVRSATLGSLTIIGLEVYCTEEGEIPANQ